MQYTSAITWKQIDNTPFNAKSFDRSHQIQFGGGTSITASSAPEFLGKANFPNPEELFTASISSCFMLTFLYWAAMKGLAIEEYTAEAAGTLAKNTEGKMAMTEVIIKPTVRLQNNQTLDTALLNELFKKAHEQCFISSSIKTTVIIQSEQVVAA
jgi:organic hydroperoxide reductase OsmC/OhrA